MTDVIDKACRVSTNAHAGQYRRFSSMPYVVHPARVAIRLYESRMHPDVVAAGFLHDVPEDTDVTLGMLAEDFSQRTVAIVDRLTRRKAKGEPYGDYLFRVAEDDDAVAAKMVDMTDNLRDALVLLMLATDADRQDREAFAEKILRKADRYFDVLLALPAAGQFVRDYLDARNALATRLAMR